MIHDSLLLAGQFLALLVVSAGCGAWVWLLSGRPPLLRQATWVWCSLAGFCLHALALQALAYLDLPLASTARPAFGAACLGLLAAAWASRKGPSRSVQPEHADARLLLGVFLGVLAAVGVIVLATGPSDYFGRVRYDQANYVATAQFLVERPFSTDVAGIGLHPWIARALEAKQERITMSVAHGALAALGDGDCQRAYGAMIAFFTALTGLSTTLWLRTFGASRWLAALGGVGAALGPAVTAVSLDGYFSQASTLFVLPALAALLVRPQPTGPLQRWTAALLLAFWFGAYSEVAVVGISLVVTLRLTTGLPWLGRMREVFWINVGALALNIGYAIRLPAFLSEQYTHAQKPGLLAALMPDSGTWLGWGRLFLDLGPGYIQELLALVTGALVLGLMVCAVALLPRHRRMRLWATLAIPVALLAWLGCQPVLAKYPFAKLMMGFTPLWIGTAVLGLIACAKLRRSGSLGAAAVLLGAGIASTVPQQLGVIRKEGALADLISPGMQRARHEARTQPGRKYLVAAEHPLIVQWLCYYARDSEVYVDGRHVGDRIVPSETYAFRRMPATGTSLWWLDPVRQGPVASFAPACRLRVRGAVNEGLAPGGRSYEMAASLQFEVDRPAGSLPVEYRWLDFVAVPPPAEAPQVLELTGAGQPRQRVLLSTPRMLRFHLRLMPGQNTFTLRAGTAKPDEKSGRTFILQSLSLDPTSAAVLANDPVPAEELP